MKKDDVRVSLVRALVATMAETRHTPRAIAREAGPHSGVAIQQSGGSRRHFSRAWAQPPQLSVFPLGGKRGILEVPATAPRLERPAG